MQAKFICERVIHLLHCDQVTLISVRSDEPEDNRLWLGMPDGAVTIRVTSEAAYGFFREGDAYRLTFTPTPVTRYTGPFLPTVATGLPLEWGTLIEPGTQ